MKPMNELGWNPKISMWLRFTMPCLPLSLFRVKILVSVRRGEGIFLKEGRTKITGDIPIIRVVVVCKGHPVGATGIDQWPRSLAIKGGQG
jgi:hypothetical protein